MKIQELLALCTISLCLASCINNKETKAKKIIRKYVELNFDDPKLYEPVYFGKLDSAFQGNFLNPYPKYQYYNPNNNYVDTTAFSIYEYTDSDDPLFLYPKKIKLFSPLYGFLKNNNATFDNEGYPIPNLFPQKDSLRYYLTFPKYRKVYSKLFYNSNVANNEVEIDSIVKRCLINEIDHSSLSILFDMHNKNYTFANNKIEFFDKFSSKSYRVEFYSKFKDLLGLENNFSVFEKIYGFDESCDVSKFQDIFWTGYALEHKFRLSKKGNKKLYKTIIYFDKDLNIIKFDHDN